MAKSEVDLVRDKLLAEIAIAAHIAKHPSDKDVMDGVRTLPVGWPEEIAEIINAKWATLDEWARQGWPERLAKTTAERELALDELARRVF
jgi:hypothetical protein